MPVSDIYTVRFTPTSAATGATAAGSVVAGTTVRLWVVGVYAMVGNTNAVSGNDTHITLARPANTPTGTTTATPNPNDFSAPASIGTAYTAWSTAPTIGAVMAEFDLPMASGSEWVVYPPTNYEWQIPAIANGSANNGLHVFYNSSVATSTPLFIDVTFSQ